MHPAKTRIRLGIHTVCSEPCCPHEETLCSWLSIERTASEDSDQMADAHGDLSLRCAQRLVCWFCHVAAHLYALYLCEPVRMGCELRVC